jgi:hypothetical protein
LNYRHEVQHRQWQQTMADISGGRLSWRKAGGNIGQAANKDGTGTRVTGWVFVKKWPKM